MSRKRACLIIDLREGENLQIITDIIAILSAAGWKVETALKEYGGEALKLAAQAAKEEYDLVIAFGGDGTLNQVLNGVVNSKGQSVVGVIPGGTANEWANEIGLPQNPIHASLSLVDSTVRRVDLGSLEVQRLISSGANQSHQQQSEDAKALKKQATKPSKTKHHFLLMAGIGMDAAIMAHVSKALKYRVGRLAFDVAAVKELPKQHPFPVEIWEMHTAGSKKLLWSGEAWQVILANTRRYANVVELAPQAYLDDGKLDLFVFKAGNALSTVEEVLSLLLRHKPDSRNTEHFQSAHLLIRVPASIGIHLDGSVVELKDYLKKDLLCALNSIDQTIVEYRFDADPAALQMAIPRTYDGSLFKHSIVEAQQPNSSSKTQAVERGIRESAEGVNKLLKQGTKVTVAGVAPYSGKEGTYIIAGTTQNQNTGDTSPVALRVNDDVMILCPTGEHAPPSAVQALKEEDEIMVEGKKSKRGVIQAKRIILRGTYTSTVAVTE